MPKKQPVRPSSAPVSFHDAPAGKSGKYKAIIERAKAAQVPDRPGDLTGTPNFEDTQKSWESRQPAQTHLSPNTAAQLEAVAHATANAPVPEEEPEEEEFSAPPEPEEELSDDERLRRAVEDRITNTIDIGRYLMNGETTQTVPIIPGKLEVTFRTVTDLEESYVDGKLAEDKGATARVFLRQSNEWALAFHIAAVNGKSWPATTIQGDINDVSLQKRLGHIKKLSSPVFSMITQNLVWFLERVNSALTVEALGNG
jgi:hypothetical protein